MGSERERVFYLILKVDIIFIFHLKVIGGRGGNGLFGSLDVFFLLMNSFVVLFLKVNNLSI